MPDYSRSPVRKHTGEGALSRGPEGTEFAGPWHLFLVAFEFGLSFEVDRLCCKIQVQSPQKTSRAPFATFRFSKKPLADRAVYPIHSDEIDLSKRRGSVDFDSDPDSDENIKRRKPHYNKECGVEKR